MNLYGAAKELHSGDPYTKPLKYYEYFDGFLRHHRVNPRSILEIGTHKGESAELFAKVYPDAKIVSLDKNPTEVGMTKPENLKYIQCDQANSGQLNSIITNEFPDGIDLVVDDASHIGFLSKITFDAVFPAIRSGGAYFIEDWGTGYWDSWVDGSRFQKFPVFYHHGNIPNRIPSHDFGMVGFVKSLVDMTHERAIKNNQSDPSVNSSRIAALEFREGVCMVLKA